MPNLGEQQREHAFKSVVDPLFHLTEGAAAEYLSILRSAHDVMRDAPHDALPKIASDLAKSGFKMVTERREINAVIDLGAGEDEVLSGFAIKIAKFFSSTHIEGTEMVGGGFRSYVPGLSFLFDQVYYEMCSREEALSRIANTEERLRRAWGNLCADYAAARLYCLPPGESLNSD